MKRLFLYLSFLIAFGQPVLGQVTQPTFSGVYAVHPEAERFIAVAGITNTTQKRAIRDLVSDLKTAGIWGKFIAIYPFVGGTATSHSYNLVNPSLYQVTWTGSPTHDANGVDFNGTSQYGNTGLNALSVLSQANNHISLYSRDNTIVASGDQKDVGAGNNTTGENIALTAGRPIGDHTIYASSDGYTLASGQTKSGFFLGTRTGTGSNIFLYRNNSSIGSYSSFGIATMPNLSIYIGAQNTEGTATSFSNRQLTIVTIGEGLNSTQGGSLYTAVSNYNNTLVR
jgi:hypothetical protein